jgi:hypothetical protein
LTTSNSRVTKTFEGVRGNLDRLIEALTFLGYVFDVKSRPENADWVLEVRLSHAIAYAQTHTRKKTKDPLAVFEHSALAWVRNENIKLPSRFYPHPQAPSIRSVDPDTAQQLDRLEERVGEPLPATLKAWFLTCGAVDLRGRHPFLNPQGKLQALHVAPLRQCVDAFADGWLPLSPDDAASSWKVRVPDPAADATLDDGRLFTDALREAFRWAGVPGLATAAKKPARELEYVRSRLDVF